MDEATERRVAVSARLRAAIDEILQEREYQEKRWGTERDRHHTAQDWISILTVWLGKAASNVPPYNQGAEQDKKTLRKRLIQVAAICLAAIEALSD